VFCFFLKLGNIGFVKKDADSADIEEGAKASLIMASHLFNVDKLRLEQASYFTLNQGWRAGYYQPLNYDDAVYNRDAMSKAVYHGLFHWIVSKINTQLYEKSGYACN